MKRNFDAPDGRGADVVVARTILTPRQREVLCLAAYSNREIARRLGISHQTIKNHWTAIYRRLLPDNRSHARDVNQIRALLAALRQGIVELSDLSYGRPIVEKNHGNSGNISE